MLVWGRGSGFWIVQGKCREMKRRFPGYFGVKELFLPFFLGVFGGVFGVPDQLTSGDWKLTLS